MQPNWLARGTDSLKKCLRLEAGKIDEWDFKTEILANPAAVRDMHVHVISHVLVWRSCYFFISMFSFAAFFLTTRAVVAVGFCVSFQRSQPAEQCRLKRVLYPRH